MAYLEIRVVNDETLSQQEAHAISAVLRGVLGHKVERVVADSSGAIEYDHRQVGGW